MPAQLLVFAAVGIFTGLVPRPRSSEVAALRAHFDSVNIELRSGPMSTLTPHQRSARRTLIGWLREYRDAGRFPRNDEFLNRSMPYFRDSDGVLCAMAYLIYRSGRADIVDRIAVERNNAYIRDLADDRALGAWLDSVGLTVAEAARIQPSYPPAARLDTLIFRYDNAWTKRDTLVIGRFLAPQYEHSTINGGKRSRAETLAMLHAPDYRLDSAHRSVISRSGDTGMNGRATLVSSWFVQGSYRGKSFTDDLRCTQEWQWLQSSWKIVSEQCVANAPATPG